MESSGRDRVIVALDVPSVDLALRVVDQLDNISFFKIGLQLFVTGGVPELLRALRDKRVFVDLKVPGDIGNTIAAVIDVCVANQVRFLTLSESMPPQAVASARAARDAHQSPYPQFLTVPFLSSLDAQDLATVVSSRGAESGSAVDLDDYIVARAGAALKAGCDGVIVSGSAIAACRKHFPHPVVLVSPGIRPAGSSADDQKRHTTPAEAVRLGADYLVVGRPIVRARDPRRAAAGVIDEIDAALAAPADRPSHI
jgi:orotidine-5'-phosphate decarboxylase